MAAKYVAEIRTTARGYTLRVLRDGAVVRRVTGLDLDGAKHRAAWWRKEMGARVKEVRHG